MFSAEYKSPQIYHDSLIYEARQKPNQWIIPKNEKYNYGIGILKETSYIELSKRNAPLKQIYQTDEPIQLPEKPFLPTISIRKPEYPEPNKINLSFKEKGFSLVNYNIFCKTLQVLEPQMTDEQRDNDCPTYMESNKRKPLTDQELDEYVSWTDGEGTNQLDIYVKTFLLPYETNRVPISSRLEVSLKHFVTAFANAAEYEAPQKHKVTVDNMASAFTFAALMYTLARVYNKVRNFQVIKTEEDNR